MPKNTIRFDFSDAHALVTGGSGGIGLGTAKALADAGASVTITGTRPAASDYDVDLTPYDYRTLQVTDPKQIHSVADSLDRVDILINNAGANFPGGKSEWEPDAFEEAVAINLFGSFRMALALKDKLADSKLEGGASIINTASMSSFFAVPMVPGYGAAKAAVVQMTKNLAVEWAELGIRVNAIAPGLIESNMTAAMKGIEELEKPQISRTPMNRWGTPEDIAPVALFLSSPGAKFITGQTICVDGGYSAA